MSCIKPFLIRSDRFHRDFLRVTSKGYDTGMTDIYTVPCGQCMPCRVKRVQDWTIRLIYELGYYCKAVFTTLTYNDEHLLKQRTSSGGFTLDAHAISDVIKRIRSRIKYDFGSNPDIKYFGCGEYGDKGGRPHYHIIIFGLGLSDDNNPLLRCRFSFNNYIEDCWPYGLVFNGSVSADSCAYVAGYIQKKILGSNSADFYGDCIPPYLRMSKGIGKRFFDDNLDYFRRGFISWKGKDINLPRYYYDRIREDALFKANYRQLIKKGFDRKRNITFKEFYQLTVDKQLPVDLLSYDDYISSLETAKAKEFATLELKQAHQMELNEKARYQAIRNKL